MAPQHTLDDAHRTIRVSDGTTLHYIDSGEGDTIVLVPGWSQTAEQWRKQIEDFSQDHRVVAIDLRGHGDSEAPEHGYRIGRLAHDLHDVLVSLDLRDVTLIGHSMGASVVWSYWDQFGGDRIARLVLADQVSVLVADPAWPDGEAGRLGAIFDYATVSALNAGLKSDQAAAVGDQLVRSMFTPAADPADVTWAIEVNEKLPRAHAGTLLVDHCFADWRDVLPRIDVPTLVIGGEVSIFPASGNAYVAESIPNAQLRIFTAEERGSHFLFWENPELFNSVVREFLSA